MKAKVRVLSAPLRLDQPAELTRTEFRAEFPNVTAALPIENGPDEKYIRHVRLSIMCRLAVDPLIFLLSGKAHLDPHALIDAFRLRSDIRLITDGCQNQPLQPDLETIEL